MAISKRLRFEVLRRDNHTCRYCGAKAPDVKVTVDHVTPVALGGTDEAINLVTACGPCNSGKSSINPGDRLVADVQQDAMRWAVAMHAAIAEASGDFEAETAYREQFKATWDKWKLGDSDSAPVSPLDPNWETSIDTFRTRGLPIELLLRDVRRAMAAGHITPRNTFRYMCGIAWKDIEQIETSARAMFEQRDTATAAVETWDQRVERTVLDAAMLVWRTCWAQEAGDDPEDGLEQEAREVASLIYPSEVSPARLMAAAQAAGEVTTTAISDFADPCEYEEWDADRVTAAWSSAWSAAAEGNGPDAAMHIIFHDHLAAAEAAGYAGMALGAAAHQAGTHRDPRLADHLVTAASVLEQRGKNGGPF